MRRMERKLYTLLAAVNPPERRVTYGVKIDKTVSDPFLSVTYTDDAAAFLPSSGNNGSFIDNGWESRFPFNKIRPCVLKNGAVQYYLDPANFRKKRSGAPAPVTAGSDGDVMIEFPKIWYSITQDSRYVYVRYSNYAQSGFTDYGMSYKGVVRERFFVGAYFGLVQSGKLRSMSMAVPTFPLTLSGFRTAAQAVGEGYEILPWNKLILLQILFIVRFKSLNAQAALGIGLTNSSSYSYTGVTDALGMNYGKTASVQMKFCGLEDFYGNMGQLIDGIILNGNGLGGAVSGMVSCADGNFLDTGAGYTAYTPGISAMTGYMNAAVATDTLGFFPLTAGGTADTYFCDYVNAAAATILRFPQFGGNYTGQGQGGPFSLRFTHTAATSSNAITARLCYLG